VKSFRHFQFLFPLVLLVTAFPILIQAALGAELPAASPGPTVPIHEGVPDPVTYSILVLEEETQRPLPGVAVLLHEDVSRHTCLDEDCRMGCSEIVVERRSRGCLTDANGLARATFSYWNCQPLHGELFETVLPVAGSFGAEVLETLDQESYHQTIFTRTEPGQGHGVNLILYATREERLAELFAPVLHKHRLDLQANLGDINLSLSAPGAVLRGFAPDGRCVFSRTNNQDLHAIYQSCGDADSYGGGTVPLWWQLDLDNSLRYLGAPEGSRPLYYHVFPWPDGGAIVQFWSWYDMNDLRQMPGPGSYHEGDWECVAVKVLYHGGQWVPEYVNFYRHLGGKTVPASECWWSESIECTYLGLEHGYRRGLTHPHVWVGANSHASYNRDDLQYKIDPPVVEAFRDLLDYNIADSAYGDHLFFAYDRLVSLGEYLDAGVEHNCHWLLGHWKGPLNAPAEADPVRFVGWFGERHCPEDVPEVICSSLVGFPDLYTGARSPLQSTGNHEWRGFTIDPDGWNLGGSVNGAPNGNYLGRFLLCPNGSHDFLTFRIPSITQAGFAEARITRISGNVRFLSADSTGRVYLPLRPDGTYLFDECHASGEGQVRIDLIETPAEGSPVYCASDLRADIVAWGPAGAQERRPGEASSLLLAPTVGPGPIRVWYAGCTGPTVQCEIFDAGGRRIDTLGANCGNAPGELRWDPEQHGAGIYFIRLWDGQGWSKSRRVVVVR
jgi:hypothetical protein